MEFGTELHFGTELNSVYRKRIRYRIRSTESEFGPDSVHRIANSVEIRSTELRIQFKFVTELKIGTEFGANSV